jgi:hypothetical protein
MGFAAGVGHVKALRAAWIADELAAESRRGPVAFVA